MKEAYNCLLCGYEWLSKSNKPKRKPKACPSCKQYNWDQQKEKIESVVTPNYSFSIPKIKQEEDEREDEEGENASPIITID